MKNEKELNKIEIANKWLEKHRPHVSRLISKERYMYEPTGSDAFHPELWKGAHWRWFYNYMAKEENLTSS